jgi:hypothetical protein
VLPPEIEIWFETHCDYVLVHYSKIPQTASGNKLNHFKKSKQQLHDNGIKNMHISNIRKEANRGKGV